MAEEAGKVFGIEKFDGTDFAYWRMQIEDYLYRRKLHLPLLGTKPKCMKADEWAFLDRQVLRVIRLTLSRSVVHNIVKEKTIADLMKALSGMYEKPSANYKVHLMKILFNLNMTENASVAQHLNEFNTITNQLSSVKIDFDDEICALIVLASLPNIWETMRMVVRNSTGKEKLKYNDIQDLILAEEIHQRDAGKTSGSGSALNLETRGRGNDRNSNRGRSKSRNSNRNISKSRSGQQVQCWNCGKTGHFRRQCKSPKKKNENDSANAVTEEPWMLWVWEMSGYCCPMGLFGCWRSKLDAKFKICFFIGYGDEKFGYRSTVVSDVTEIDQKKSEFVNLDELTKSTVQKEGEDDKENINSQVDLSIPVAKVCRSSRNIKPPQSYSPVLNYLLLTDGGKPECYDEALQDENSSKWELAMKDEMDSLLGNRTWELTELPIGKKALHNKWVYRIKNEHDRSKRYKTRLVVKGFQQKEGIDYIEIFSLIVKMSTIRLVLGMVAAENLHLEQLDVKTPFLHGDLEEDLYMIQPEGFIVQG
ncbi:Retrovirus-related Pol polyprotein from transposon TNT 1-94 [Vitis vinifera]|uniref:Retrovirus-related Pol polyprotein from transposon TNT 1-94 n=1 Tax=Vitis vinifera TaxID=29760 RepID=A0A438GFI3_VITVI|nr:Retrovirus-related Pol polyprotein from transposon TNT 1-94 [Vitis vinifera]